MSKKKTFTKIAMPVIVKFATDKEFRTKVTTTASKAKSKIAQKNQQRKNKG